MSEVFRVNKTKDYTVMCNHHFKNKKLSLRAKGLLSLMLSLPDDWNYTIKGLTALSKDGRDSVIAALKELEKEKYIIRRRLRNAKGQVTDTEYIISEIPITDLPTQVKPTQVKPIQEKPKQVNPIQSNTNILNTNNIKYSSINHSNNTECVENDVENFSDIQDRVKEQIDYRLLCINYDRLKIDNVVAIISNTYLTDGYLLIDNKKVPYKAVREVYDMADYESVERALDNINEISKTQKIKNVKNYFMVTLYNSILSCELQYDAEVNYDLYH